MTDQQSTNPREFRAVEQLTSGAHVNYAVDGDFSVVTWQVGHAAAYTDANTIPMVAVTLIPPGGGEPVLVRERRGVMLPVSTEAEIADARAEGRRLALAAALHQFAGDVVRRRLPLASYRFTVSAGHLDSQAEVERWAEYLGVEVGRSGASKDIAVANSSRPIAEGLSFDVHAQGNADPEPEAYRVAFDLNTGVKPLIVPVETTVAELTAQIREAFLAAELIDAGHEIGIVIDGDDEAVVISSGEIVVSADGHVVEHGSIAKA
ncbi:hypothetical protein M3G91_23565 [Micromonospora chalcea]|uniref:hypothetical protein n=1 Tax=Micromonospora chalcea TaxID=1874 RepID=UPI0021A9356A|nr:hypothetical protein [Micromonospora chalcea]MCT2280598.1 hypothetical protein [Micromonospora chalcea]